MTQLLMKRGRLLSIRCCCLIQSFIRTMRRLFCTAVNRLFLHVLSQNMSSDVTLNTKLLKKMVVGLGNHGMSGTRHSVGMAALDELAARLGTADQWQTDKKVCGRVTFSEVAGIQLILLKPKLLMNINGVSVARAAEKFHINPEDIYLVHDEIDKPFGKLAMKNGGSARGHNGVRSCVSCLGTDVMRRLRIGIGRPTGKISVESHVLSSFSKEEQKILTEVLQQSIELLLKHITEDSGLQTSKIPQEGIVSVNA
ncbi:probable peptidyl-tRNA hydrolase [Polypterus senegalus]|uniref:probable peptidyl-tRNA hydrolase n=1 Tax=Polypterus senegalus TaxID=55291 RepID=UPI0019635668|nr:probable peptidyl-tRNA hydrolase [Polypterus senegalus]